MPELHFYLPPKERVIFCIESRMSTITFQLARFRQMLFLGLPKCLPESEFYLPRAIGQVLIVAGATKPRISKILNVQESKKNMAALTL